MSSRDVGQCPKCKRLFLKHSLGGMPQKIKRCIHYAADLDIGLAGVKLDERYDL